MQLRHHLCPSHLSLLRHRQTQALSLLSHCQRTTLSLLRRRQMPLLLRHRQAPPASQPGHRVSRLMPLRHCHMRACCHRYSRPCVICLELFLMPLGHCFLFQSFGAFCFAIAVCLTVFDQVVSSQLLHRPFGVLVQCCVFWLWFCYLCGSCFWWSLFFLCDCYGGIKIYLRWENKI